jgi:nucleoside-diphosphate-sugar epimerase
MIIQSSNTDSNSIKVMVIGASGFIGSHIVRYLLEKGVNVIVAVRKYAVPRRLQYVVKKEWVVEINLLKSQSIYKAICSTKPDIIILAAAYGVNYSEQDFDQSINVNVKGGVHLVEACKKYGVNKLFYLGTSLEYGNSDGLLKETNILAPQGMYGAVKAASTIIMSERALSLGIPLIILRLFNVWGPLEGRYKLVPQVISSCLEKTDLYLTSGEQIRDYIFVKDVVNIIYLLLFNESISNNSIINIGSGRGITIKDFVCSIATYLDGMQYLNYNKVKRRPDEPEKVVANVSKLENIIGNIPISNLHDAIKCTIKENALNERY